MLHVIVVSASIVPDVVDSDGLFNAPEGGDNVKEEDEFHQF
jgi:hypothetical protein